MHPQPPCLETQRVIPRGSRLTCQGSREQGRQSTPRPRAGTRLSLEMAGLLLTSSPVLLGLGGGTGAHAGSPRWEWSGVLELL